MNAVFARIADYYAGHAVMTAVFYVIGRAMQRRVGEHNAGRRLHGQYVFWWMIGGFGVVGLAGPFLGDGPGAGGVAGFALLLGRLIGTVHGAFVLWWRWWRWRNTPDPSE